MGMMEDFLKKLNKEIGESVQNMTVEHFIDTNYPPLNKIISGRYDGGIPCGRITEIYGASSSGKTLIATQLMINAQKMGGVAVFIDWERSFDVNLAKKMGMDDQMPYFIYRKPKTWEEGNADAKKIIELIRQEGIIEKDAPILVVFDSVASAVPRSQFEKDVDEYNMNDTTALARVASTTLKVMGLVADERNATLLYLNQIRTKPNATYSDSTTTPGGSAMGFSATVRISVSRSKLTNTEREFIGQKINLKAQKSKLTKPFQECALVATFDEDGAIEFDFVASLLQCMKDEGKLESSGAYVTWIDGKKYYPSALTKKIKEENGYADLCKLLKE